jgi:hypothetical protein
VQGHIGADGRPLKKAAVARNMFAPQDRNESDTPLSGALIVVQSRA